MIVAVPLRVSNRRLKGEFAELLDSRLQRSRGRPALAEVTQTARYPLATQLHSYRILSALWRRMTYGWPTKPCQSCRRKTLWEIGVDMRFNRDASRQALSKTSCREVAREETCWAHT
jgi:hypothetical protein